MRKSLLLEKKREKINAYMRKYYAKKTAQKKRVKMVEEVLEQLKKAILAV